MSLGTGSSTRPIEPDDAKRWGLAGWAPHILDVDFDGVSDTVDYQLAQILGDDYFRMQTPLRRASEEMDNASEENLDNLKLEALDLIARESAQLDQICRALTR